MADPYETLGVARTADANTIKQAYRKLAKRYHPDVNPGNSAIETKFKEVNAAHDLLSDPTKRTRFDRGEIDAAGNERAASRFHRAYNERQSGRSAGANNSSGGFQGFDADDIFEIFNQGGKRGASAKRRGADISYSVSIDFIAANTGTKRRLTLPDGRVLNVDIPPGTAEGTVLRLKGQGQAGSNGGPAGDAFIEIHVEPHPFFERLQQDIHVDVPITLQEAVVGASITVPTIDGNVSVKVPPGSNTGTLLRLKNRGVPNAKSTLRGDQYVRLTVMLPERNDPELTEFVERWGPKHEYRVRGRFGEP